MYIHVAFLFTFVVVLLVCCCVCLPACLFIVLHAPIEVHKQYYMLLELMLIIGSHVRVTNLSRVHVSVVYKMPL